jgi:hypothetical protein
MARRVGSVQGFDTHQLARPNSNFVPVLRRSNPGCNITLLTDQSTQFAGLPADVHVFRHPLDKARLGRNAWANYYQFRAQQARCSILPSLRKAHHLLVPVPRPHCACCSMKNVSQVTCLITITHAQTE